MVDEFIHHIYREKAVPLHRKFIIHNNMTKRIQPISIDIVHRYRESDECRMFFARLVCCGVITPDGQNRFDLLCRLQAEHDREPGLAKQIYFERVAYASAVPVSDETVRTYYYRTLHSG